MKRVLEGLAPARVFEIFEDLTQIPHGSGNVKQISDYCVNFAKNLGLQVRQDEFLNVIIVKEASAGYPSDKTVMIQGHIDMVCEKNQDNPINMETDPLKIGIDGDWIHANGTTLGGDDGIAVAYALAILEDNTLEHPRLEVVLTTDEETGMDGALGLDVSDLKAEYMINVDSEREGEILTSCAGGNKSKTHLPIQRASVKGEVMEIAIRGLKGGHSGDQIHTGRANSNIALGRILYSLLPMDIRIVSMEGGLKDNAIPREAQAEIVVDASKADELKATVETVTKELQAEFAVTEPELSVIVSKKGIDEKEAMDAESTNRSVRYLFHVINGIQTMSFEIENLVESSLNLGVMRTLENEVTYTHAIRSSKATLKAVITEKVADMAKLFGGSITTRGDYPAWEYKKDSKLRPLFIDKYEESTGKKPEVCAIHAGLECGLLSEKMPYLDIVSIGPDMQGIHTPEERLNISSTKRVYEYLLLTLKDFYKYCE